MTNNPNLTELVNNCVSLFSDVVTDQDASQDYLAHALWLLTRRAEQVREKCLNTAPRTIRPVSELRIGDVWTERPKRNRPTQTYRVIEVMPGLTRATLTVEAENITTWRRRTFDFFLVNKVEVRTDPAQKGNARK